jgi:uncharacterized protein (DUF362 family)
MLRRGVKRMEISRRDFIRKMMALGFSVVAAEALFTLQACRPQGILETTPTSSPATTTTPTPTTASTPTATPTPPPTVTPSPEPGGTYLAVARGESPSAMVEAVIKALGGIERFVKSGNDVIIKPNICNAYHTYEYGSTTNPEVVGTLVGLCLSAGAKKVRVMDYPHSGSAEEAYVRSGISEVVRAAGGEMEIMPKIKFRETSIPQGLDIKSWPVYSDALAADVLINVPIAKTHGISRLTLGMKNLMGLILERGRLHSNLGQRVADLTSLLRPALTVVDAVLIMIKNGPTGGSLNDVKLANTVIASHDIVAADAYAATLFGLTGADIPIIRAGAQMGLGTMDLDSVKVEEISV